MKKVKVSHRGRVCRHSACRIILSIYNHGLFCHIHEEKEEARRMIKTR
jgi:hypothetical protein